MANNNIHSTKVLSVDELFTEQKNYISNVKEPNRWTGMDEPNGGRLIMELISGLGSLLSFHLVSLQTEQYLSTCRDLRTARGVANLVGYSAFRGKNMKLSLVVNPDKLTSIQKFDIIGTYNNQSLIFYPDTPEEGILQPGVQSTLTCIVGSLKEEKIVIDTVDLAVFEFTKDLVSEDYRIFLKGREIPEDMFSLNIRDLINGKFFKSTNVNGSVSLYSLNDSETLPEEYIYTYNDELVLQYVEYNPLIEFTDAEITLNIGGLDSYSLREDYIEEESLDNIKVNAPIYANNNLVIRGREDYMKSFLSYGSKNYSINKVSYHDDGPEIILLSYVRDDESLLTGETWIYNDENELVIDTPDVPNSDTSNIINYLDTVCGRPLGIRSPRIVHPVKISRTVKIEVKLFKSSSLIQNIQTDIQSVIDKYQRVLNQNLDLNELEYEIENFSYVKRCRVSMDYPFWEINRHYSPGDIIIPTKSNGYCYRVIVGGTTSFDEPTWPTTLGNTITDGTCTFETISNSIEIIETGWNKYFDLQWNPSDLVMILE